MSAIPAEISGPVSQRTMDAPANKGGSTASDSENKYPVNKVYVMHGLLLSGIELALTVGNAVNLDAFALNSFSDLIFGGSVVIEAVGFVFAVAMALRALMYPVAQGLIGVGVPAVVIVEAMAVPGSHEYMQSLCFVGLLAQSVCFLVFAVVSWITSSTSLPTVSKDLWISMGVVCAVVLSAAYKRLRAGHDTSPMFLFVVVLVPKCIAVYGRFDSLRVLPSRCPGPSHYRSSGRDVFSRPCGFSARNIYKLKAPPLETRPPRCENPEGKRCNDSAHGSDSFWWRRRGYMRSGDVAREICIYVNLLR